MRKNLFVALLLAAALAPSAARASEHPYVAGVLQVKVSSGLPVYASPSKDAPPATVAKPATDLPVAELGQTKWGLFAYARKGDWFEVETQSGRGWIAPENVMAFHSLETLLTKRTAYFTPVWDGALRAQPGAGASRAVPGEGHMRGAKVVGVMRVKDALWLKVQVRPAKCPAKAAPIATGWVPAYGSSGAPTLWYDARGC